MVYERGAWEKLTSGVRQYEALGKMSYFSDANSKKLSNNNSSHQKIKTDNSYKNCPVCGKRIKDFNICPFCGHYFQLDNNKKKFILSSFKSWGWNISNEKSSMYLSSKFYFSYYSDKPDNIIKYYGNLIKSKSYDNRILYVSNNLSRINSIKKFLIDSGQKEFILDISDLNGNSNTSINFDALNENIENFKKINILLNNVYSVRLFNDSSYFNYIFYLDVLKNDCKYIDENDAKQLNEFIKIYYRYTNYLDSINFEYMDDDPLIIEHINKYSKKLFGLKKSIIWFSNQIDRLDSCYRLLEVNSSFNVSEKVNFIDDLLIMKYNPNFINYEQSQELIDLLIEYQKINILNISSINRIGNLREKCILFTNIIQIYYNFSIYDVLFKEVNSEINLFNQDLDLLDNLDLNIEISNFNQDVNNYKFEEIKELLKINYDDISESIENTQEIIDDLFNIINNIFSSTKNTEFNFEINFELYHTKFNEELEKCSNIFEIESKIDNYNDIIKNNLSDIWTGLFSDITEIKNKLKIDQKYTYLYNKNLITENTLKNFNNLSNEDTQFLETFKSNIDGKNEKIYINLFENKEKLLNELNALKKLKDNDLKGYYEVFKEINLVLKLDELDKLISCLEKSIKKDVINSSNEYLDQLSQYNELYFRYFNEKIFNISFEELIKRLNLHIMFTDLINNKIVSLDYLPKIKDNIDDFIGYVNKLEELFENIKLKSEFLVDNPVIKKLSLNNLSTEENKYNIIFSQINTAIKIFDKNFINNFDYVILDDNENISQEDRLQLFLISKNKLYRFWND